MGGGGVNRKQRLFIETFTTSVRSYTTRFETDTLDVKFIQSCNYRSELSNEEIMKVLQRVETTGHGKILHGLVEDENVDVIRMNWDLSFTWSQDIMTMEF